MNELSRKLGALLAADSHTFGAVADEFESASPEDVMALAEDLILLAGIIAIATRARIPNDSPLAKGFDLGKETAEKFQVRVETELLQTSTLTREQKEN